MESSSSGSSSIEVMQPLDGISLHHLDHTGRKVGPDVAEPARDPRRGRAEPAGAPRANAILLGRVIERGERGIHLLLLPAQGGIQLLGGRLSEQQPPAQSLVGRSVRPDASAMTPAQNEIDRRQSGCCQPSTSSGR